MSHLDSAMQTSLSYEDIMRMGPPATTQSLSDGRDDAVKALSARLVAFRKWLSEEADVKVHSAICVVNGEATDGTKNAPVLIFGPSPDSSAGGGSSAALAAKSDADRVGIIDRDGDQALYDRTMGCQVRAVRDIKKDEVMMTMPRPAMITPDLVASSDAGKAILGCCRSVASDEPPGFWDTFENTTICESRFTPKVARNTGAQILVKILQERKRAESALRKRMESQVASPAFKLVESKTLSTRAPLLAFLIHQRFFGAERPSVSSEVEASKKEFQVEDENALHHTKTTIFPPNAPETFGPYARTLPSSVSLPLCWKRNELALLAGCIPGFGILQEVATCTMQLASEFIALLDAGIQERFPETFPRGLLTWERWVWAAAISASRALPASCYLNAGDSSAESFSPASDLEFQSPPDIWSELGVMIPLLDMLNHEIDANQITWEPCVAENSSSDGDDTTAEHPPRAVVHKKIRKGAEVFTCYGDRSNSYLMLQYGFALMNNGADEVRLGWSLSDGVGEVKPPHDCTSVDNLCNDADAVYESNEERAINQWWSDDRLQVLEREAFRSATSSFMDNLKAGKKLSAGAFCDGTYDPILLSAAAIATLPSHRVQMSLVQQGADKKLVITRQHQRVLKDYLRFSFTRKLEKLLQNLDNGLKDHFASVKLWTKASDGGLSYKIDDGSVIGWQSFFDSHAYNAAIEVEKRYYAMGADSCVLTLYDGQLHALQASVDGVADDEKFASGVLRQLEDLGFDVAKEDSSDGAGTTTLGGEGTSGVEQKSHENGNAAGGTNGHGSVGSKSPRSRKRSKKKSTPSDRPRALKLHVGNLSYATTPSDLYDSFSKLYGEDNVLECHIPIERETGRSRGFGFVAMPEEIAMSVLQSGRKHEVDGRLLKIAKSNSAGSGNATRVSEPPVTLLSDRCATCGYRPKYCTCAAPSFPGGRAAASRGLDQESVAHSRGSRDYNYRGSSGSRRRGDRHEDPDWHREYDWERQSRSYDREEDRYGDRGRRERGRGHSRERSPVHSSRHWDYDDNRNGRRERTADHDDCDGKRSRSRSREKGRKKKSKRHRSRSGGHSYDP